MYSPHKAVWWIPKLILIAYKNCLLLKINTISEFLLFSMKYLLTGVAYFMNDACNYFIIPMLN